ncbi:MAG TPA: SRPBCC family protein [Gaiellaceae bacterium]|nr:SRPBCC family protein [Gaiellaceae bacterium]
MRSETVTTVIEAPKDEVFRFLSDVENLPEWATEFARELEWRDGEAVVVNGLGEFVFRIAADPETGVIDMLAGPSAEELVLFPTRVVSLSDDRCAFTFTMFQGPEMPDELFESQHASLQREFENLEARFGREGG